MYCLCLYVNGSTGECLQLLLETLRVANNGDVSLFSSGQTAVKLSGTEAEIGRAHF